MATNQPPPNYGFSDQPGGAPQGYPGGAPMGPPQGNGMAVAGLVLGIISIVLFFLSWIAAILGILGIIFGALGISKANKIGGKGKGMATAGLVCGVLGMIISIAVTVWAMRQISRYRGDIQPVKSPTQYAERELPAPLPTV